MVNMNMFDSGVVIGVRLLEIFGGSELDVVVKCLVICWCV